MRTKKLVTVILAGCAVVVALAVPVVVAQAPQEHKTAATATTKAKAAMTAKCQAMMAEHEKMMAETKAADQRLDALVATMNAASGTAKADATSAVVNELVTQRRTMRDGMMKMHHDGMGHMMEHMQAGKDSMAMCPMMKQMGDVPMGGMKH